MDAHGRSSEECAISSTNKRGQRRQLVRSGSGSSSISSRGADSEGALPTTSQRGKGRVASGLFSSMRSAGRSVRASLGMPSSRRGTSESSAAASDDARGGKDARGRSASGEELAVAKDEVLQQYMVQARSLLRTLDDACGEAAAWEASALTAVAATETCHKMMEARLIVSRGKDELAKLGIVRSAFEKYTSVATSASLDSLRSLSALAGAARAGIMRVLSLAGCQRADAGDKQIQSYRKAAANCISAASQALDDLNTQLVRSLQTAAPRPRPPPPPPAPPPPPGSRACDAAYRHVLTRPCGIDAHSSRSLTFARRYLTCPTHQSPTRSGHLQLEQGSIMPPWRVRSPVRHRRQ